MRQARAKPLTAQRVKVARHSGQSKHAERLHDGGARTGLALNIRPSGTKSWVQTITVNGRRRAMGLGRYPKVSLADARRQAELNQAIARDGLDPRRPPGRIPRFRAAAAETIDALAAEWTSPKSRAQWESSMRAYAFPVIGDRRVDTITPADVLAVVEPIWTTKRETAQRVRQRISAVMGRAIVMGHRTDNPASADTLRMALPRRRPPVRHFRALHHGAVGAAIATIRATQAYPTTRACLEFAIRTAARSGEARGATWAEVDLDAALWTIPAARMKAKRAHRVPLAPQCVALLDEAQTLDDSPLVFPSPRGKMLSDNTLSKLLRDHAVRSTVHGFRSSFRDWCGETGAERALAERALAHVITGKTERAYARSDLLDRRRDLMVAWNEYLDETIPPGAT